MHIYYLGQFCRWIFFDDGSRPIRNSWKLSKPRLLQLQLNCNIRKSQDLVFPRCLRVRKFSVIFEKKLDEIYECSSSKTNNLDIAVQKSLLLDFLNSSYSTIEVSSAQALMGRQLRNRFDLFDLLRFPTTLDNVKE